MAHDGHRDTGPWVGWKAACSDAEAGGWQQGILGVQAAGRMSVADLGDWAKGRLLPRPRAGWSVAAWNLSLWVGQGQGSNLAMSSSESLPI